MFRKATIATFIATFASTSLAASPDPSPVHDIVLRGGMIYDGSGNAPFPGEVAVDGERIVYVGPARNLAAHREIDVHGQAIAPGFINMLAHPEESLLVDGRALSDLTQGVTLEVMGEFSMGPLNKKMKQQMLEREEDIKYSVTWTTLGEYLSQLERQRYRPKRRVVHRGADGPNLRPRRSGCAAHAGAARPNAFVGSPGNGGRCTRRHDHAHLFAGDLCENA